MEPMSIDAALLGGDAIRQVKATADGVFWLTRITAEDSRTTIKHWRADGTITEVTPQANVRSRVMEYGGGAYAVAPGLVAWCDDATNQLWLRDGSKTRPLTPASQRFRYGGLSFASSQRLLLAVREDHEAHPEERSEIVALDVDKDNADGGRVLVTGADFYAGPTEFDGRLAWSQWMHPNMSWDSAQVLTCQLNHPAEATVIAGGPQVSAQHPIWLPQGDLAYVSDASGYWNWTVTGSQEERWHTPRDCSIPIWVLDTPPGCVVDNTTLASVEIVDGRGRLALWTPGHEASYPLPGTAMIESIAAHGEDVFLIAEWDDRAPTLVHLMPDGTHTEIVASLPDPSASKPNSRWAAGPVGPIQAWFYPIANTEVPPPLLVLTHGGPTSVHYPSFDKSIQFWVSRGFAVLDVNYSGSTGFGRAYRERLKGEWGVLDVADVVAAAQRVCADGLADPTRVAIAGGSAGGYTTLQALTTSDFFSAGISSYGIGDLRTLVNDTHKAESHYTFSLVGPWPEAERLYLERSPITQLDQLTAPMLILQGLADRVVPPNQAYDMASAVRAKGLPLALVTFTDEGHGFRSLSARRQALESQVSFLEQVFELPLSPDIPTLQLENMS
ncbi:MAG: prolyl oligopeptidase family serine peptidase [Propionibacteriaceae bacterium]|nr:prolyl oligopeptidase family serine peptidase [Propionibacteriaceae bacterium]